MERYGGGNKKPVEGDVPIAAMWVVATDAQRALSSQSQNLLLVRSGLRLLQDRREQRMEQFRSRLPPIMWAVLISGAVLVIGSACLSGNEKMLLHSFHVLSISFVILLTLSAVADLARPFEGGASVSSTAFQEVLHRMTAAVNPLSLQQSRSRGPGS